MGLLYVPAQGSLVLYKAVAGCYVHTGTISSGLLLGVLKVS